MRKLTLTLLTVLVLLAGVLAPVASAQEIPVDDLTALAAYVPANTSVFAAVRTDQAYFETLDALLRDIAEAVGEQVPPGGFLGELNRAIIRGSGGALTYESAVESWLGNTAAIAVITDNVMAMSGTSTPAVALVEVTDRDSAEQFLDLMLAELIAADLYSKDSADDTVLYRSEVSTSYTFLLTDNVLYIGNPAAFTGELGSLIPESLAETESFTALLGTLPETNYNIIGYMDLPALATSASMLARGFTSGEQGPQINYDAIPAALGPVGFGATILGGRTLALDLVHLPGEGDLLTILNLPSLTYIEGAPADPDFAGVVPADTAFYMQGTSLGSVIAAARQDLDSVGNALLRGWVLPQLQRSEPEAYAALRDFDVNNFNTFIDLTLEGTLGMTSDEVFNTLGGQYAQALRIVPVDADWPVSWETVQVFENVDNARTERLVDGLARLTDDFRLTDSYEDGRLVVRTTDNMSLLMAGFMGAVETEIVTAYNRDVLATGWAGLVDFALDRSGDSLLETDAYQFERGFFLNGAQTIYYVNFSALRDLLAEDGVLAQRFPTEDFSEPQRFLSTFDSAAVSAATGGATNVIRFTLTLAE
jgi:hypothetical protein